MTEATEHNRELAGSLALGATSRVAEMVVLTIDFLDLLQLAEGSRALRELEKVERQQDHRVAEMVVLTIDFLENTEGATPLNQLQKIELVAAALGSWDGIEGEILDELEATSAPVPAIALAGDCA